MLTIVLTTSDLFGALKVQKTLVMVASEEVLGQKNIWIRANRTLNFDLHAIVEKNGSQGFSSGNN